MNQTGIIEKEDYLEPACLLCGDKMGKEPALRPVPLRRVTEKLDDCIGRKDYDGAMRLLDYWLQEAEQGNDRRGQFSLYNEKMGLCRKLRRKEEAFAAAQAAQALLPAVGDRTLAAGTCMVNCATVYHAFDETQRALPLFERARSIYEANLPENDGRLGGLYNNMALALTACRRFGESYEMNLRALEVMKQTENGALEMAITYLNMADAVALEHGEEKAEAKINQYLELAAKLLDDTSLPRNGYYAFVCEKCESVFEYYGWFLYAQALKERYEAIYAGNGAL